MKHKLQAAIVLMLALALIFTGVAQAAATYLDDFVTSPTQTVVATWNTSSFAVSSVAATVLGGERDIVLDISGGNIGQTLEATVNNANDGLLTLTSGTNIQYTAQIQYDGSSDSPKENLAFTISEDLTTDSHDRFLLGVPFSDLGGLIFVRVYTTDALHCSEYGFYPDAGTGFLNQRIYAILYADFWTCTGATDSADFTDADAVVIEIGTDGGSFASLDINLSLFADSDDLYSDFGDLPDSPQLYERVRNGTTDLPAQHLTSALSNPYMGAEVDEETDNAPSTDALGDDTALSPDDEDGVTRLGSNWIQGTTAQVRIRVTNCTGTCYVSGFIDWNRDSNFWRALPAPANFDADERILNNVAVYNGDNDLSFSIPSGILIDDTHPLYARFRLTQESNNAGGSPWGAYYSGEVEDYYWSFGPTAVTLANVTARSNMPLIGAAAALVAVLGGAGVFAWRRKKSQ